MPWPDSRNVLPGCVPAGIVSRTRPLSVSTVTSAPRRASSRVNGSSRSRSAPRRVNVGSGGRRTTTMRSPPPGPRLPVSLIRVPVSAPGGIVISSRLPSTSTSRVVPWYASSRVISASASWVGGRRRAATAARLAGPAVRPSMPIPPRMSSKPMPPVGRDPRPAGRRRAAGGAHRLLAEEHPEEVAELAGVGGRAELVADVAAAGRRSREATERRAGAARRARLAGPADRLPVGPELVVLLALGRDR